MRRMVAIQMGAAVLLAFLWAPFLHVHKAQHHENGPHEHGGLPPHRHETVIHAHLPDAAPAALGHDAQEADLSHANHDAEPLSIVALQAKRSEEHTSELQSRGHLVCRLLLEKKNP